MGFLNEEGLQYYNEKVQTELAKKQNADFPDGSIVIPVKEIGSAEYNALSEEEKNLPILYIVRDGDASLTTIAEPATLEDAIEVETIPAFLGSSFAFSYRQ